jgi:glycosyltransferase involved in cell wall biosynthesis
MRGWFVDHGHFVAVVVREDGLERRLFDIRVKIIVLGEQYDLLGDSKWAKIVYDSVLLEAVDTIISISSFGAWAGATLSAALGVRIKVIHIFVYPTFAPSIKIAHWQLPRLYTSFILKGLGESNVLFLSDTQRKSCERALKNQVKGQIWELPISSTAFERSQKRVPETGLILSIGRLSPMKEYNLAIPLIARRLLDAGFKISWSIYGDGPFESEIESEIDRWGVRDVVCIKGRLPYEEMPKILARGYVFVGMGTAALEAAAQGVPGPLAIPYDKTGTTHGTLDRLPQGSLGDLDPNLRILSIEKIVSDILRLKDDEYTMLCRQVRNRANEHDLDRSMDRFVQIVEKASVSSTGSRHALFLRTARFLGRVLKLSRPCKRPT